MVERDSTQRLWKFPIKGGEQNLIIKDVDSIGYYCWLENNLIAISLISDPNKLEFADIKTQKIIFIQDSIGRSLHFVINNKKGKLFFSKTNFIYSTDLDVLKIETQKKFIGEDFCFLNDQTIIMGDGGMLYKNQFENKKSGWIKIADLSKYGIINITRIAISPDGKKMAIVAHQKISE